MRRFILLEMREPFASSYLLHSCPDPAHVAHLQRGIHAFSTIPLVFQVGKKCHLSKKPLVVISVSAM